MYWAGLDLDLRPLRSSEGLGSECTGLGVGFSVGLGVGVDPMGRGG